MSTVDNRVDQVIAWIRATTESDGFNSLLVPISGGSDSALCFWLCAKARPGQVIAAFAGSQLRCRDWFESVGPVHFLPGPLPNEHPEAARWAAILAFTLGIRGWLVGSRNRTEEILGTYSLASRVAAYLPLAGLWKTEVMELSALIGVPAEIMESSRRADPECGRQQEMADLPFEAVDRFLKVRAGERPEADLLDLPREAVLYLDTVYHRNRFKAFLPIIGPRIESR